MGVFNQVMCSLIACFSCMSGGLLFTWPSFTISLFGSTNTTLDRPMTDAEIGLFSSLSSIGALISTPIAGLLLDRIGRKYCIMSTSLIQVLAWTLIASCKKVELILTAMFISGLGGAIFLVIPALISEICQENIRGAMTTGVMVFYSVGMLVQYLLGGYLPYKIVIYICTSVAVMTFMSVTVLKETPTCLMSKGLEEEAKRSMAFYRNVKVDSKVVLEEMEKLRRAFNPQLDEENSPETEKFQIDEKPKIQEKLSFWQFIKKSRSTRKAMFVTLVLMTSTICEGLVVLQVYAEPMFAEAVPTMSSTVCSVLLAAVTIAASGATACLADSAGRRSLMIWSSFASCASCLVLGTQLHLHWAPHWVTAVFIYLFTVAFTFGGGTVPFVLVAEVFLPEVKSFMSMFVIEWAWFCNFLILFIFNPLVGAIGLGPVFYLFAGICLFTAFFSIKFLPETKGLTCDAIQKLFS